MKLPPPLMAACLIATSAYGQGVPGQDARAFAFKGLSAS